MIGIRQKTSSKARSPNSSLIRCSVRLVGSLSCHLDTNGRCPSLLNIRAKSNTGQFWITYGARLISCSYRRTRPRSIWSKSNIAPITLRLISSESLKRYESAGKPLGIKRHSKAVSRADEGVYKVMWYFSIIMSKWLVVMSLAVI